MKYKIIDKNTEQIHICNKVTINGFAYYVSENETITEKDSYYYKHFDDDIIVLSSEKTIEKGINTLENLNKDTFYKKIIATNNPDINLPLVFENNNDNDNIFTQKDMIDFASWTHLNGYSKHQVNDRWYDGEFYIGNSKRLLDIWKIENELILLYYE